MSELTANLAYSGVENFEKANENRQKAGEGVAHVAKGLWEIASGSFGAMKRDFMGHGSMYLANMAFVPEMIIEQRENVQQDMKNVAARRHAEAQPATERVATAAEHRTAAEPAAAAAAAEDAGARSRTAPRAAVREREAVPPAAAADSDTASDNKYTVKKGDSLWKIVAEEYRANHDGAVNNKEILAQVNALKSQTNGDLILPGMVITLNG